MKKFKKLEWQTITRKRDLERLYKSIIPVLRAEARECGYGLGVHGSLQRDLDLIAVPWVTKHVKPLTLALRLHSSVSKYEVSGHWLHVTKNVTTKPCGRLAYAMYLGTHAYIDLSVMPA